MKCSAYFVMTIVLLLAGFAAGGPVQDRTDIEELQALEREIARAWVDADRAALDAILADDWTVIDVTGRLRAKADVFREMFDPQAPVIEDVIVDELNVRVLGDVGVVTGRTRWLGADGAAVTLRFTDVAVRRDGEWRVQSSQGTRVME